MDQLDAENEKKLEINYSYEYLPSSVKKLQPVLFQQGNLYRCESGPDLKVSVIGYGETPEAAIYTWDKNWQEQSIIVSTPG